MPKHIYNRVMLKLSGEALLGNQSHGIDAKVLHFIVDEIEPLVQEGLEIAIVIGAGNIWRGSKNEHSEIDRVPSDYMGMMGTIMNSLALQAAMEERGMSSRVLSALDVPQICERYAKRRANHHLKNGRVVICAGGTGNPYFTTDSAAALRALELECDVVLKATNVDGVYDADPRVKKDAKKYDEVTFDEVLEKDLKVMDATAVAMCRDNHMPLQVFKMLQKGNITRVVHGDDEGTKVVFTD